MAEKIEEAFHYNFDNFIKDIQAIKNVLMNYVDECIVLFDELVIEGKDLENYYKSIFKTDNYWYINTFLKRPSEAFMVEELQNIKLKFWDVLTCDGDWKWKNHKDDIENWETARLSMLKTKWSELEAEAVNQPIVNLGKYIYANIDGIQTYVTPECDENQAKILIGVMKKWSENFPTIARRLDCVIVVPKAYIELIGGDGTMAYTVEDAIFVSCEPPEDRTDILALSHEFGHHLYKQLSSNGQIYWQKKVREWDKRGTKTTRDPDRNSQYDPENFNSGKENIWAEELYADVTAIKFHSKDFTTDEDYIHYPAQEVIDEWNWLMKQEFSE